MKALQAFSHITWSSITMEADECGWGAATSEGEVSVANNSAIFISDYLLYKHF